jgi:1-acyl-sn-glycerol-3-phosphate acyltransferase
MAVVEKEVEEHLSGGGILSLFPEGAVNKKPGILQTFRHGTFKKAIEKDAKIWHFVLTGHEDVWPHNVPIAGYPCYTGMKLIPVIKRLNTEIFDIERVIIEREK